MEKGWRHRQSTTLLHLTLSHSGVDGMFQRSVTEYQTILSQRLAGGQCSGWCVDETAKIIGGPDFCA
jgi:hypothetical protein